MRVLRRGGGAFAAQGLEREVGRAGGVDGEMDALDRPAEELARAPHRLGLLAIAVEDEAAAAVFEDVCHLVGRQRDVDRHQRGAQEVAGEVDQVPLRAVGGEERDAVALLDAAALERDRDVMNGRQPLLGGPPAPVVAALARHQPAAATRGGDLEGEVGECAGAGGAHWGARGLGPKSALPMRTWVAPSSTAISKSSLMPIERSPRNSSKPGARATRSRSSASARNQGRDCSGASAGRRHRHEPDDFQRSKLGEVLERARKIRRSESVLGGFTGDVHFEEARDRASGAGRLLIEGFGQAQPIDRVDGGEGRHRGAGLVGLQRPDEVPLDAGRREGDLRQRLLHAALAEHGDAGGEGGGDQLGRLLLAGGDQGHGSRVAAGPGRGRLDAGPDLGDSVGHARRALDGRHPDRSHRQF